jgi:hypothetical protein
MFSSIRPVPEESSQLADYLQTVSQQRLNMIAPEAPRFNFEEIFLRSFARLSAS